ncbi:hypothetical protein HK104_002928 [Borealophlyctis nickersoniae]|nr:hypothetical protein HK104_002928 [Borealophlyctis nickersoniae]
MSLLPLELLRQVACASRVQEAGRLRRSCVSLSRHVTQKDLVQGYTAPVLRTGGVPFKYSLVKSRVRMSEDVICLVIDLLVKEWGEPRKELGKEDALFGIFILVISKGFLRPTRLLLDYGLKWTDDSRRPIRTCFDYEQVEMFRLLLEGIDIDKDYGAIAYGAGCTGNPDILRVIMPRCNLRNQNYALCSSSKAVKVEGLELLVNSGWRITFALDNGEFTHEVMGRALAKAALLGEVERLKLLARGMVNLNWGESQDQPPLGVPEDQPLYNAIKMGRIECIQILLEHGALITNARINEAVSRTEAPAVSSLLSACQSGMDDQERPEVEQFWLSVSEGLEARQSSNWKRPPSPSFPWRQSRQADPL